MSFMAQCKEPGCPFFGSEQFNGFCSKCSKVVEPSTNITLLNPEKESKESCRCKQCNRKVGLLGFTCQCKNTYCKKCRHAEQHNCTYDYMSVGKMQLMKDNPHVHAAKLQPM
jgi:hypothetical protein